MIEGAKVQFSVFSKNGHNSAEKVKNQLIQKKMFFCEMGLSGSVYYPHKSKRADLELAKLGSMKKVKFQF